MTFFACHDFLKEDKIAAPAKKIRSDVPDDIAIDNNTKQLRHKIVYIPDLVHHYLIRFKLYLSLVLMMCLPELSLIDRQSRRVRRQRASRVLFFGETDAAIRRKLQSQIPRLHKTTDTQTCTQTVLRCLFH